MVMKKYLFGIITIMMSLAVNAAPRSMEKAAEIAAEFTNHQSQLNNMRRAPRKATDMQFAHRVSKPQSDEAALYIFNQADNRGFVMVSADDNAVTILGYSDEGTFNADHIPSNVRWWLDYYAERVAKAQPASNKAKKAPKVNIATSVAPLLGSIEWNQSFPYNAMCPIDLLDTTQSASGCGATAAAQIMRYWKWPKKGKGSHSYTWEDCIKINEDGKCIQTHDTILSADFGATTYDWDNMLEQYNGDETAAQNHAVAELMYHIGVASEMDYGGNKAGGSGTVLYAVARAMLDYFDYNEEKMGTLWLDDETTYSDLAAEIQTDLLAGRPVFIAGYDSCGGHAFVCDGMDTDGLFHINWGWGGTSNGFFALSALDPDEQGIGGSVNGSGFSKAIQCLLNIEPNKEYVSTTGVSINKTELTLKIKERFRMTYSVLPDSAFNKGITWSTSDSSIVRISASGLAVGVSAGTAIITATTIDGKHTATCAVTVLNEQVPTTELNVDYGFIEKDEDYGNWKINVANTNEDYVPYVRFYINSHSDTKIAGKYNLAVYPGAVVWLTSDPEYILSSDGWLDIARVNTEEQGDCNTYRLTAEFYDKDMQFYTMNVTLELCARDKEDNPIILDDFFEGINEQQVDKSGTQRIIENGQVIIVRGKDKYSVLGQKIQ